MPSFLARLVASFGAPRVQSSTPGATRRAFSGPASRRSALAVLPLAGAVTLGACGEPPRTVDAQAVPSAQSAEVSIRFDVGAGRPSTVQVMAFRATTSVSGANAPGSGSFIDL